MAPSSAAHRDDRDLVVEGHQVFVEQRRVAERRPGGVEIGGRAQYELALAVVAQRARLEHARQADGLHRRVERGARIHGGITGGRDAEQFEGALFAEPVLRGRERTQRRGDACLAGKTFERLDRDVLPVEGDDVAAFAELA